MTAVVSTWLVGAFELAAAVDIEVNGVDEAVSAGEYYIRDATPSRSLIDQVQAAVVAQVPGSTVRIGRDRKIRIVSGGGALTLVIPNELQGPLGMPANPTVGTTVVADDVSTLLWSPGWPETTNGHPRGTSGWRALDSVQTASPSGQTIYTEIHAESVLASWSWKAVPQERLWTVDGGEPGELERFRIDVLEPGARFKLYSDIVEDDEDSTAVTWTTALGPYKRRGELEPNWWNRTVKRSDVLADVSLDAIKTSEVS